MNFLQYNTPEELYKFTGLTVKQALQHIDKEISRLKKESYNPLSVSPTS